MTSQTDFLPDQSTDHDEYERRFAGTAKVYGEPAFNEFEQAHVMVIGIGGVGSWAAEALARSGIGELTLVDMDVLVASNINRQLPALTETFGYGKVDIMAKRIAGINPKIKINLVDDFLTPDNTKALVEQYQPNLILDCIDDVKAKLALILHCRFNKIPLIVSGGAGGKLDPLKIRVADLSRTEQDPMLAKIRSELRNKGICKKPKDKFGITCIYSIDNPFSSQNVCASAGLRCGGYGSAITVTASFGMVAAAEVLKRLAK
ncbi:ThiF family adenylyltransferase [Alkanindiges sp. WGS2144]|uniref:tRNA threonylcarbamoyladenosine dehydratase n=1 Tax=Alkanindiges sp. WGS2144 TaxID=3366808 RepID=UPI003751494D